MTAAAAAASFPIHSCHQLARAMLRNTTLMSPSWDDSIKTPVLRRRSRQQFQALMRKFIFVARSLLQNARAVRAQPTATFSSHSLLRAQQYRRVSVLTASACLAASAAAILTCGGQDESSVGATDASLADQIKSNYAARISTYSSPEKIFLSYATASHLHTMFITLSPGTPAKRVTARSS
jgi:hypothetical protein